MSNRIEDKAEGLRQTERRYISFRRSGFEYEFLKETKAYPWNELQHLESVYQQFKKSTLDYNPKKLHRKVRFTGCTNGMHQFITYSWTRQGVSHTQTVDPNSGDCECTCEAFTYTKGCGSANIFTDKALCKHLKRIRPRYIGASGEILEIHSQGKQGGHE